MPSTENKLWVFSNALYAKPQIADCFLQLQDRYQANVNILLWCIWLERQQMRLTSEKLTAATECIQQWDSDYVQVLRTLRRKMKVRVDFAQNFGLVVSVREKIKQAELEAEKQEQQWLENLVDDWNADTQLLIEGENLAVYLHFLGVPQVHAEHVQKICKSRYEDPQN